MIYLVDLSNPRPKENYFWKFDAEEDVEITDCSKGYEEARTVPVILSEFERADYGKVISVLKNKLRVKQDNLKVMNKLYAENATEGQKLSLSVAEQSISQLQSAINILKTLGEGK